IPTAFGALIALYLSAIYGTISYRGIESWDKDQQGLAIISSIVTSLINLRFLSKLCMNSSKGYYETFRSIVSCNYHAPLGFAASKEVWVLGRIAITCLSNISFRSIASVLEENMPFFAGELSLFAPIASGILLNDSLNRSFDRFLLSPNAC